MILQEVLQEVMMEVMMYFLCRGASACAMSDAMQFGMRSRSDSDFKMFGSTSDEFDNSPLQSTTGMMNSRLSI